MKKIIIKLEYELEIPENWDLKEPSEEVGNHLFIKNKYYDPDIIWLEYTGDYKNGSHSYSEAPIEIQKEINDTIQAVSKIDISEVESFESEFGG